MYTGPYTTRISRLFATSEDATLEGCTTAGTATDRRGVARVFVRLFPLGIAGADVLANIAPDGWQQLALHACFHPSVERGCQEAVRLRRNVEKRRNPRVRRDDNVQNMESVSSAPAQEQIRKESLPTQVNCEDKVTELVGLSLCDIFSDITT
jgi:hypothetical protein